MMMSVPIKIGEITKTYLPIYLIIVTCTFMYTLWLFNIAMENCPFTDDFPIKTSIYKGFSMAIYVKQPDGINLWLESSHQSHPSSSTRRSRWSRSSPSAVHR